MRARLLSALLAAALIAPFGAAAQKTPDPEPSAIATRLIYDVATRRLDESYFADVELSRDVLAARLAALEPAGGHVIVMESGRIAVELPAGADVARVRDNLTVRGGFTLHRVVDPADVADPDNPSGLDPNYVYMQNRDDPDGLDVAVARDAALTGEMLDGAEAAMDGSTGRPVIYLHFTDEGSGRLCALTQALIGEQMAMAVDGVVLSAPYVTTAICGGSAQIAGGFTFEEAWDLARAAGRPPLPRAVRLIEEVVLSRE